MFCPQCGKEVLDNEKFCGECGTPIEARMSLPEESAAGPLGTTNTNCKAEPEALSSMPEASEAISNMSATKSSSGIRMKLLAVTLGAAALTAVLAIVGINMLGNANLGQNTETFKAGFSQSEIMQEGVASSTYLNPSAYELTEFSCSDIQKVSDGIVTARIDATIENNNYITELSALGSYIDTSREEERQLLLGETQFYNFEIQSSETAPKKGIDFDEANGVSGAQSVLSEDGKSCTVETTDDYSMWFADVSHSKKWQYEFDGAGWNYKNVTDHDSFNYKDISGSYYAKTGKMTDFSKLEISNFDAEQGTFTLDYEATIAVYEKAGLETANRTITGTLSAILSPEAHVWSYAEEDGYAYYFEGSGTSSDGDGQAQINGYLTTSTSGESTIEVDSIKFDYTELSESPNWSHNATSFYNGVVFKQQ